MRANNALIKKYGNSFLKREVDYVTNFQHEYSNFYGLSKIHKSKIISKAIEEQGSEYILCFQPKDLKLCPIVASHKSRLNVSASLWIFSSYLFCPRLKVTQKMILTFSKNAREA